MFHSCNLCFATQIVYNIYLGHISQVHDDEEADIKLQESDVITSERYPQQKWESLKQLKEYTPTKPAESAKQEKIAPTAPNLATPESPFSTLYQKWSSVKIITYLRRKSSMMN